MAAVAEFEHCYPGLFRAGEIGWRYFWALATRIPLVRARGRKDLMYAELYGACAQGNDAAQARGQRMLEETEEEASGVSMRVGEQWFPLRASELAGG